MNYRYEIVLRSLSDDDGGGWAAYVPELPGCMSDGESIEEALRNVNDAITAWLDTRKWLDATKPPRN